MKGYSFTTYAEASKFARQIAHEKNKPVKVTRCGDEFIVYIDASLTSASIEQSEPRKNRSTQSSTQTTSASGGKNADSALTPNAPQKAKGKKKNVVGLSAAVAKRTSSKKGKRIFDPRSIFITEDIEPKEISGGLPSLGKRK